MFVSLGVGMAGGDALDFCLPRIFQYNITAYKLTYIFSHICNIAESYSNIHNIASYIKGQDPSFSHCVELYRKKITLILQYKTSFKIK